VNTRRIIATAAALPALVVTLAVVGDAAVSTTGSRVASPTPALVYDAAPAAGLAGKKIYIDPGHSGAVYAGMTKQIPTGRGGTKDCQTTGTTGVNGMAEHAFNYAVGYRLYQILTASGATVMMSRNDDTGAASCVDARAEQANQWGADAVISIHADGSAVGNHGFHVNYSAPPLNEVQRATDPAYAGDIRNSLVAAGFTPATYIGSGGLFGRADLTGLNLSAVPSVLVECGNIKDPSDAALLASPDGQQRIAQALANGVATFIASTPAAVR
jgi:N-acetylmuramoyl-L-alanine amidase